MPRKRKQHPKPSEPSEPPQKQQQKLKQQELSQPPQHELHDDDEEYEEVEEEQEVEEEVEVENDDESDEPDNNNNNNNNNNNLISSTSVGDQGDDDDDDDEDEPIETLMELFAKEQLIKLLREAADKHEDVADRIRMVADEDPVHRKIFVHGLGWDTNAETLMNTFKAYGEIEDCKAVSDKISGKSKGYGFILFKHRSGARKALKEPQKRIGSRMTACQLAAVGPAAAPVASVAAPLQPASEYTQRKIYVSNVGADLDPQKLVNFFAKFGEIEEGPLGLDKVTGKPRGFCLFVYKSVESARKALEEPHKNFEGHILHCQKAIDGPKPGKSQQQPRHHMVARNDNAAGYGQGNAAGPSHMMGPVAGPRMGFNQGATAAPALNPALGQALTALLATQGAGLGGLTNLLGTLGSAAVNPGGVTPGMQGYGNQANVSPGVIGAYATQGAMQGGYPNQQMGQGGSGRGQHAGGQYGGVAPYMGH